MWSCKQYLFTDYDCQSIDFTAPEAAQITALETETCIMTPNRAGLCFFLSTFTTESCLSGESANLRRKRRKSNVLTAVHHHLLMLLVNVCRPSWQNCGGNCWSPAQEQELVAGKGKVSHCTETQCHVLDLRNGHMSFYISLEVHVRRLTFMI